jgi:DNA-binding HxlR family transcriptional regulator
MTQIKDASSIQENKKLVFQECPITYVMERIGGYWKPIILFNLLAGPKRYGEIRRTMPQITEKVLIQQLKQLEADDLLIREAKPVIPPHVVYRLSDSGKALQPILYAMAVWAVAESGQNTQLGQKDLNQFPVAE